MPKLDLDSFPVTNATNYPAPYAADVAGRWYRRLGPASGLSQFAVSHVRLDPGARSSQRHWHEGEDEFVVMLSGEAVLVDEGGRVPMLPGDCAAFPRGDSNGHMLVNESDAPCTFLAFGQTPSGTAHYPDIDLGFDGASQRYVHKNGTPY